MRGAILSVGDELTLGQTLDTNSRWLSQLLAEHGVLVTEHRTVADDRAATARAVRELATDREIVVITGGLGPTEDDLTRHALGDVATPGEELVEDAVALVEVERWFSARKAEMPLSNRRQALRPRTMRCLPNANGTAPGLAGRIGDCLVFALPGPPRELQPMAQTYIVPELEQLGQGTCIVTAAVLAYGLGESRAAARLGDMMHRDRSPLVGTTASDGIISARIRAQGPRSEVEPLVRDDAIRVEQAWGAYAFGRGDESLASAVGKLLLEKAQRLASAESCTGGWLGKSIVDVAGSSAYYLGGWVTYSNAMKGSELGVTSELLETKGAVSPEVADAMARGALTRSGADHALSITGVAGPDGGTVEKPVGCVFIAHASRISQQHVTANIRRFQFTGDRQTIRDRSVQSALQMLRFALLGADGRLPLLWEAREPRSSSSPGGAEA